MRTYRALLRGDHLEWLEEAPESQTDAPLRVHVTVLEQESPSEAHAGTLWQPCLRSWQNVARFPRSPTLSSGNANSAKIVYCQGARGDARR